MKSILKINDVVLTSTGERFRVVALSPISRNCQSCGQHIPDVQAEFAYCAEEHDGRLPTPVALLIDLKDGQGFFHGRPDGKHFVSWAVAP